jgi:gamma-glutamyltranspeptidase/glutathione hydrolase
VSSGGICLVQMLNILENFEIDKYEITDSERVHIISEVFKIVFADRYEYIGDPEYVDIPIDALLSKKYALQRAQSINLDHAQNYEFTREFPENESSNTTHFNVADAEGNIVSMTQTINSAFGSKVAVDGTGMLLNNCMMLFDPHAGNANSIQPYKRSLSSMTPTIIFKDDEPFLVLGTPGGRKIFGAVCQALLALIDTKVSLQAAVESPRVWTDGDVLELEYEFPDSAHTHLKSIGHDPVSVDRVAGGMNAIKFEHGSMEGAACHRADGSPAGLSGGYALPSQPGDAFRV